jgi:hypothetical protein
MRLAVVVAPSDPRAGDAVARREALAWLRGQLARNGFEVIIVGGGQDPAGALDKAAMRISPGDTLFVHVSGRLSERGALAFGAGRSLPLRAVADALAGCGPAELAFVAELMHADDPSDSRLAADCLAAAVEALSGSPPRGTAAPTRGVLAAVRPLSAPCTRLAFTERTLTSPTAGTLALSPDALVASMYRRALEDADARVDAPWLTFSPAGELAAAPAGTDARRVPERPLPGDAKTQEPSSAGARGTRVDASPMLPLELPRFEGTAGEDVSPPSYGEDTSAVDAEIAAASAAHDWKRVLDLRLARLSLLQNPASQVNELIALARLLQTELGDSEGAMSALEQARAIDPHRPSVLLALRRGYETLGRWASAIEVIGVLVELARAPVERAALLLAQASLAVDRIGDEARASRWLRAAVSEDPANADARTLLARLEAIPIEADGIAEAELSLDDLLVEGEDGAVVLERTDAVGLAELEVVVSRNPFDGAAYAQAHALYVQDGSVDAAFLAAMALEALGAADVNQQATVDHFRSMSPVRARASLDAAAWDLLRAPGFDEVLAAIFSAVERPAIAVRLEDLYEQRKQKAPDREGRLGETSTASIVRSFQWGARFLGIGCPDLYVVEDARGCTSLAALTPSTALGPDVLSGQSAKDLAFLAGNHLTRYRPEYRVLSYYPTREDVTMLLFAAAQLGMPTEPVGSVGSVGSLRARLARHATGRERIALAAAVSRLDARGGQATVGAWMRSTELTAARAGLLLCGDLATAMALVASELCAAREPALEARRGDLIAFCASRAHAELRARFVTIAGSSVRHTDNPPKLSHSG